MLTTYTWLLRLLVSVALTRLLWRGLRNRDYWRRWSERFGFGPVIPSRTIWIHAVSVGEVRASAPLVRALAARYPEDQIFITTTTPTGSAQVRSLFGQTVAHRYVPYDLPSAVERFLERVRPRVGLIMETELWPTLFHACRRRGIPLLLANVRLSESSMRGYRRVARLVRSTLAQVDVFCAQSQADAARLLALGAAAHRVHVTGSIKFELNLPASLLESADALRGQWGRGRRILVAASTHAGEEEQVLDAYRELKRRFADALLVIAPRHPERFASVARLCRRADFHTALRSEQTVLAADTEILVGDTMGELQLFLAACDVAFVGGSLVPVGGHNILEASAVGVPVVFGPHMSNFQEISAMALARGAGMQIRDGAALAPALIRYLEDPNLRFAAGEAGKRMVAENRGALEKTLDRLARLLPAAP